MSRCSIAAGAAGVVTLVCVSIVQADDWPQWRGPRRDGVWRETGLVTEFRGPRLPPKWQTPVGPGYSGPTVADGRVFLTDRQTEPDEAERVLCFDAQSGRPIWQYRYTCSYDGIGYTAGPRACVTIDENRAYSLGAAGHLHCLDAASGKLIWSRDLVADFRVRVPIWGIAAAPLIVDDLVVLHVGGRDGACVIALDKATGAERWHALDDRASYSAPIAIMQAGRQVIIVWTGDSVACLIPESGRVAWRIPFPPSRMPIGVPTPIVADNRLFVSSFYDGSLMIELDKDKLEAHKLWAKRGRNERHTEALHCMIGTPVMAGDYLYGVDSYGELRCLDARTGRRIWEDLTATPKARWSTIHIVKQSDRYWMFNERGELLITRLSPKGLTIISRTKLIEPTTAQLKQRGGVCWSHPAFANRCVYARNDRQLVCASLVAGENKKLEIKNKKEERRKKR